MLRMIAAMLALVLLAGVPALERFCRYVVLTLRR